MDNHDKNRKLKSSLPAVLIIGFLIIIITLISTILSSQKETKSPVKKVEESNEVTKEKVITSMAIVKNVNNTDKSITLMNLDRGQDFKLTLTGGSDIRSKHSEITTIDSIAIGEVVEITYDQKANKLLALKVSDEGFIYKGISNWYFDTENDSIYIAGAAYKYGDNLVITRDKELLTLEDLDFKDELIVRGKDRDVWSITVTKGHGTLYFSDYDDFIGGIAYIGKREIIPIVEDMIITARVGAFDIVFEQGNLVGRKSVTLNTDEEVLVSMEEFKRPPVETGLVNVQITPNGADLFINDKLYPYDDSIELEYGSYSLKVSLGGYITYTGKLVVEEAVKTIYIDLVESGKSEVVDNDTGETPTDETPDTNTNENTDNTNTDNTKTGTIYIENPEGASAYFNGEYKGNVPVAFPKVPGIHYITLIMSGYETKTYTIEVTSDNENLELSFPSLIKMD